MECMDQVLWHLWLLLPHDKLRKLQPEFLTRRLSAGKQNLDTNKTREGRRVAISEGFSTPLSALGAVAHLLWRFSLAWRFCSVTSPSWARWALLAYYRTPSASFKKRVGVVDQNGKVVCVIFARHEGANLSMILLWDAVDADLA